MSRPEGYRKRDKEEQEDDESQQDSSSESSTEEEDDEESSSESEEEEKNTTKDKKKKKKKSKKRRNDNEEADGGDNLNIVQTLKMCLSVEKKIDPGLLHVSEANARAWRHPKFSGTQPLAYPESPLKYVIDYDNVNDPTDIKVHMNGLKSTSYSWKDALEDVEKRCFYSVPPVNVHLETQVHQLKLTFNFPGGDYLNLGKVCERVIASTSKKHIKLSLNTDQKKQLFTLLGDAIDSSTTKKDTLCSGGYHMLIRAIAMTDYNNKLPITFGGFLVTHDPITNKEKSWCNINHISNSRSTGFKGASAITIPACSSQRDIIEHMWVVPKEHYHPDVSRFINCNFDMLYDELQEMKVTGTARKVVIGPEPTKTELKETGDKRITYSTYEIKMPELTSIKADNMIQFIIWQRYADILVRTSAVPDITPGQIEVYGGKYDYALKGYRFLCVVLDSIVAEYESYMRHRNFLMSLDGEVSLALMPERPLVEVQQDVTNFISDSKVHMYGPGPSITLQIEFETFRNNSAILPKSSSSSTDGTKEKKKEKNKKEKKKVKSHKKDLLKKTKTTTKTTIATIQPKSRDDYLTMTGDEGLIASPEQMQEIYKNTPWKNSSTTNNSSSSITTPPQQETATSTSTAPPPPQVSVARPGRGRIGGLKRQMVLG